MVKITRQQRDILRNIDDGSLRRSINILILLGLVDGSVSLELTRQGKEEAEKQD